MTTHGGFLGDPPRLVNVGLSSFAATGRATGAEVLDLAWQPPADADRELGLMVARLEDDPDDAIGSMVGAGNAQALRHLLQARPQLIDVAPATQAIAGFEGRMLLHAGPPIEWPEMCGPMRGAIIGAALLEGWADDPPEAEALASKGDITFAPCHDYGAVGPMAGVVAPSMPVLVVQDATTGTSSYATLNEGLGKVLRYGAYDDEVLGRLRWIGAVLGPVLSEVIRGTEPLDLRALTAQALQMGDECHNRNVAATSLVARVLAPHLVRLVGGERAEEVARFLASNDHFFLNLSMAACKSALDAASGIPGSTLVTAMCRNGVEFGIRSSGTGDTWFTAPATVPDGLYFPGFGPADANPDIGDSAITETFGIGGFAMAAAPSIVRFVGGTPAQAVGYTLEMERITLGRNADLTLPPLGFRGTPTGIDLRRVVESRVAPVINTGIAHREAGVGQVGAGIARAPLACFDAALRELSTRLSSEAKT